MPLVEDTEDAQPPEKPSPVIIAKEEYKGVAVDSRQIPQTALMTHVEGAKWTVRYYSQVLAQDNATTGQNLDRDATFQQYKVVEQLELRVTTPLNQQQDPQTKSFKVQGQSNFYPNGVIPNDGDMFIADIGDGRAAVFKITGSDQRSIYKDAGYVTDYELIDYATEERVNDLESKVVERLVFVKDFLTYGQNPLITTTEHEQLKLLEVNYEEIAEEYFRRFVSKEYRTLLLPGQEMSIYDPFLTNAVLIAFNSHLSPAFKYIKELNVSEDDNFSTPTLWDAILNKKRSMLTGGTQKMGLISTVQFSNNPRMNSLRYSGLQQIVYPIDPQRSEDDIRSGKTKTLSTEVVKPTETRLTRLFDLVAISELPGLPQRDVVGVNAIGNDFYVFSEAFYNRWTVGQSAIEILVQQYLDDKAMDLTALAKLTGTYKSWAPLEQFYQVPIMLMLIRAVIRRM